MSKFNDLAICHPERPAHGDYLCFPCVCAIRQARSKRYSILRRQANNAEKAKQQKYELMPGELEARTAEQQGRCLICKRSQPLVVDHNHRTGNVRGLLCAKCNSGLGFFHDNTIWLERASKYLKQELSTSQATKAADVERDAVLV